MERWKICQFHIPSAGGESYLQMLQNVFRNSKIYERTGNEEDLILRTREKFQAAAKKYKAPMAFPIIFRNHSQRNKYIEAEHKRKNLIVKCPPEECFVTFTFADDIFANIVVEFVKDFPEGKQRPYLLHEKPAKIICLKREFSAEDAFEEALTAKPLYNADNIHVLKQSRYVDPDMKKWKTLEGCMAEYSRIEDNDTQFIVDVSVIYPENIWSTAFVLCYDCGNCVEVALCEDVLESARQEIWQNIINSNIEHKVSQNGVFVIRLPMTTSGDAFCSFREGLIGFTPVTKSGSIKPSLFVRLRLTFFTNEDSRFGDVLHQRVWKH